MDDSKFKEKIFDKLEEISNKLTEISTHAEYTKKGVSENKEAIEELKVDVDKNTSAIRIIEEWKEALDKIIWEILKPPLKFIGLAGFVVLVIVGGWLVLR